MLKFLNHFVVLSVIIFSGSLKPVKLVNLQFVSNVLLLKGKRNVVKNKISINSSQSF